MTTFFDGFLCGGVTMVITIHVVRLLLRATSAPPKLYSKREPPPPFYAKPITSAEATSMLYGVTDVAFDTILKQVAKAYREGRKNAETMLPTGDTIDDAELTEIAHRRDMNRRTMERTPDVLSAARAAGRVDVFTKYLGTPVTWVDGVGFSCTQDIEKRLDEMEKP